MITKIEGVDIEAIACAMPKSKLPILEYASDILDEKTAVQMARGTGFSELRITSDEVTTSDLCMAAAEEIFSDRSKDDIGALIFVSQTPDYVLPATSHVLQHRLGLGNDVLCIDINEGCSGYVTGLYTACTMAKQLQRSVCLLGGDTISKITSPVDRATRCIFGDAGTATIVKPGNSSITFNFASYGERYEAIIMENSRHRVVATPKNQGKLFLDGVGIFNFTLKEVPIVIKDLLEKYGIEAEEINLFACHQANKLILQNLARKLKVGSEKVPFTAEKIGNESSASIPLVLTECRDRDLSKVLCCGFGVGLSVGACIADFSTTKFFDIKEL